MRVAILGLVAVVVLGVTAEPANSQVGYRRGMNPYTGRVGTRSVARNPLTGTVGARNTVYNPYTGRAATNTVKVNPYTNTAVRTGSTANPYTGRVGAYGTVRRW
jgi:hypothetical protein